ncbi:MAG TPA: DUF1835 domain-containing protein [Micromonosporaceae bacterium]|jgi:hypothetical protein|nr:DUF1835 domain-containing protein [Micromonosporaceae bacterium]
MTKDADFKRVVRTRMAKTGESYTTALNQLRGTTKDVLHVTNGESAAQTLRASGISDVVLAWRDALHVGPVPAVSAVQLRRIRARQLAKLGDAPQAEVLTGLIERDRTLRRHRGAFQLWFEADLYDQLQVIQILAMLRDNNVDPERIMLICIGEYPGIGHFGGLGELTADQLFGLRDSSVQLSVAAIELACLAWTALRAPSPELYRDIARTVSGELRFLGEAFDRLGREFPSTRDGLTLTERRLLATVIDTDLPAGDVFLRASAREIRPFLGDTACYRLLSELAAGRHPLITLDRGTDSAKASAWRVGLTRDGRRVLDGDADRLTLIGIDRWIGGVHLSGDVPGWRWDEATEDLVRNSPGVM